MEAPARDDSDQGEDGGEIMAVEVEGEDDDDFLVPRLLKEELIVPDSEYTAAKTKRRRWMRII